MTLMDEGSKRSEVANADSATLQDVADSIDTLQSLLQSLRAKVHKELQWYTDSILAGGALAIRIAYRLSVAVDIIDSVDRAQTTEEGVQIGGSVHTAADIDCLLDAEYLLDDLYDAWCTVELRNDTDTVINSYLQTVYTLSAQTPAAERHTYNNRRDER